MENGGGFGNWVPNFAAPSSPIPSSSSCSPFPDQLVVPAAGTTTSAAAGPHHNHHYHHHFKHQAQAHHHLTCLKLGKRQYYAGDEPASSGGGSVKIMGGGGGAMKRERSSSACVVVPRCQVEGCDKALIDAKDYHRRHKVCEMHSKAPKVVVLGAEQRFCQQCSRFHAISEFDDSKRSCRRRLAGHNERRRKNSSSSNSIMRNPTAVALETTIMGSRFPFLFQTSPGRALSLLSSKAYPLIPTAELSPRSNAALRELIAEDRAALLAQQLFFNRSWHSVGYDNQSIISFGAHQDQATAQGTAQLLNGWNLLQESGRGMTLDLMQSPNSKSFEFLSRTNKSKDEEEECCEIWKSLEGTHVV